MIEDETEEDDSFSDVILNEEEERKEPEQKAIIVGDEKEEGEGEGEGTERRFGFCSVCCDRGATHAFSACGHLCICGTCAMNMNRLSGNGKKCIICRKQSDLITKIYLGTR